MAETRGKERVQVINGWWSEETLCERPTDDTMINLHGGRQQ